MLWYGRHDAGPAPPGREVLPQNPGADFSHAMLQRASQKAAATPLRWIEADALRLPFPDAHFDLITSAFGFRNLANYDAGLREIMRVLRPGGEFGILDFGEPEGLVGNCYRLYFKRVLPAVGTLISGSERALRLPARIGGALSRPRRNAATHTRNRLPRIFLDPIHPGHRRPIPRQEVAPASRRLSRGRLALAFQKACRPKPQPRTPPPSPPPRS